MPSTNADLKISPALEREAELAEIDAALAGAREGRGRAVLVEGPAGIGKSLLLALAWQRGASAGLRAARARGSELERHAPLGVLVELLEPLLLDLDPDDEARARASAAGASLAWIRSGTPPAIGPGEVPFAMVHSLYWLVAILAERAPLVLVADDVQWADPASLRALAHVASRVAELPVALMMALRTGEPDAAPPLDVLRSESATVVLRPAPLSRSGCDVMVRSALDGRATDASCGRLFAATGGNPFLLRELLRAAASGVGRDAPDIEALVPDNVVRATASRLGRLGPASRALARSIAVLEAAEPHHAAALAGLTADEAARAAGELTRAGFLAAELPLRFDHPLQRAAVLGQLTPAERDHEHHRAAGLLRDAPVHAAAHLLRTRPRGEPWAVEVLRTVAQRALSGGSPEAAAHALRRAVEEAGAEAAPAELLLELGQAELSCGDEAALGRLDAAVRRAGTPAARVASLAALGQAQYAHGDVEPALRTIGALLDELEGSDDQPLVSALLVSYAMAARANPAFCDDVRARVEASHPPGSVEPARLAVRSLDGLLRGEPSAPLEAMSRAAIAASVKATSRGAIAVPLDDVFAAVGISTFTLAAAGRFEAVEEAVGRLLADARRRGSQLNYTMLSESRLWSRWLQGRVPQALADCDSVIAMADRGWAPHTVTASCLRSDLLLEQGDRHGATQALAISPELERRLPGVWGHLWLPYARSGLAGDRGDHAEALEQALLCGERMSAVQAGSPGYCAWRSRAALAASAIGDDRIARDLCAEELELARACGLPRAIGIALRTSGQVRPGEEGIELLREAAGVFEESPFRLEHARSLVALGAALRRLRRPAEARDPLRRGLDLAHGCGATALAGHARDELSASGGRPRRERLSGPAALTPRELRVAELAATGLSNPEIAQALFLSRRTVESHLSSAYATLSVPGREQLADALGRGEGAEA